MPERFVNGVLLKPTIDWDLIPPFIFLKKQMLSQMAYRTRLDEIAEYLFFFMQPEHEFRVLTESENCGIMEINAADASFRGNHEIKAVKI